MQAERASGSPGRAEWLTAGGHSGWCHAPRRYLDTVSLPPAAKCETDYGKNTQQRQSGGCLQMAGREENGTWEPIGLYLQVTPPPPPSPVFSVLKDMETICPDISVCQVGIYGCLLYRSLSLFSHSLNISESKYLYAHVF